ncbi:MAG: hypothetical protein GX927_09565 [Lentisphaerae bacterium]|nr:hypothetical protein [Lentisphaerota bacterium]
MVNMVQILKKLGVLLAIFTVFITHADVISIGNSAASLEWQDGALSFQTAGVISQTVVFRPFSTRKEGGTAFTATQAVVVGKHSALVLREEDCSLTFVLDASKPAVRMSLPWNAGFTLETATALVVLPDGFGEDTILEPGRSGGLIPAFLPFIMALQTGEKSTLSCIPFKGTGDIRISGDLKTWEFRPPLLEEYTFAFHTGEGVWHQLTTPLNNKTRTEVEWVPPFKARYRAAYPLATLAVPIGTPRHYIWNIAIEHPKFKTLMNRPPRMSILDKETYSMWCSGFDGSFGYPAILTPEGKLMMRYPVHPNDKLSYQTDRPIYLYAYDLGGFKETVPGLPVNFLTAAARENMTNVRNSSVGIGPATCHLTSNVIEKIFYRSEGRSHRQELVSALQQTQLFVESVRARIENYRAWAAKMAAQCENMARQDNVSAAEMQKFGTYFAEMESRYQEACPRMKTPTQALEYQKALLAAVDNPALDDEELEDRSKQFGKDTRSIGGAQDTFAAHARHMTKLIRQQALLGYIYTASETARKMYAEIYCSSTALMQDYYDHEGK